MLLYHDRTQHETMTQEFRTFEKNRIKIVSVLSSFCMLFHHTINLIINKEENKKRKIENENKNGNAKKIDLKREIEERSREF